MNCMLGRRAYMHPTRAELPSKAVAWHVRRPPRQRCFQPAVGRRCSTARPALPLAAGGFSLGQAAPNLQYFAQAKAAGARVFDLMARQPEIDPDAPGEEPSCWEEVELAHFLPCLFAYDCCRVMYLRRWAGCRSSRP